MLEGGVQVDENKLTGSFFIFAHPPFPLTGVELSVEIICLVLLNSTN